MGKVQKKALETWILTGMAVIAVPQVDRQFDVQSKHGIEGALPDLHQPGGFVCLAVAAADAEPHRDFVLFDPDAVSILRRRGSDRGGTGGDQDHEDDEKDLLAGGVRIRVHVGPAYSEWIPRDNRGFSIG
jgi:hypothetical protein